MGASRQVCTIQRTAQFRGLRADAIRPYSSGGEAAAIHRTAQLRTLREAESLPYRTQKLSVFSVYVTGRVREPTCGYNPRASLSGGTAARLRNFRFSLCTLPGGSGNQRIGTSSVRHCPAALPPASTASKCFADYQLLCELLILRLEIRIFYGYNGVCVFVIGKLNHWKISRLSERQSYGAARCGCRL